MEANHPFRFQKDLFDGTMKLGCTPILPSGTDVHRQMDGINYSYGKHSKSSQKRGRDDVESSMHEGLPEEVSISTIDAEVFQDPDNYFEDENEEDTQIVSTQQPSKHLWKK